ncbi:MAG: hypothetical protein KAR06_02520 [Deltaproteobacteria bacterium]|nr:hypothetical protein [Deltaproteobacteria bacterium]
MKKGLTFDNPTAVHKYLVKMGYKMGKSKLNSKLAANLKSMPRKDGVWNQAQIDRYAEGNFEKMNGVTINVEQKVQLEIDILKEDLRKKRFKNDVEDGEYIPRSEVEKVHSAKLQHLMSAIDGFFQSKTSSIITLCEGNTEKVAEVKAYCIEEIGNYFDEYATPCVYTIPISSPIEKEEEAID